MRYPTLIAFLFLAVVLPAQITQVLKTSTFVTKNIPGGFAFIESDTDTTKLNYIATIRVKGAVDANRLPDLYYSLKDKANSLGANSFKLQEYIDSVHILVANIYYASDSALLDNNIYHEKNMIYVFGSDKKNNETYTFKVNGEKKEILGGSYYRHVNYEGQEVKLNKGGAPGATVWIKWKLGKPSTFLGLSGLKVTQPPGNVTMGIGLSTGGFSYIDNDLGYLLRAVLKIQG